MQQFRSLHDYGIFEVYPSQALRNLSHPPLRLARVLRKEVRLWIDG